MYNFYQCPLYQKYFYVRNMEFELEIIFKFLSYGVFQHIAKF